MTLLDEQRQEALELWKLVLEKKQAAETLVVAGLFGDGLSRAYYSGFHAVTLLFFLQGVTFSSHKQILGQFNKVFVDSGAFSEDVARKLEALFDARQSGDYDHHVTFDKEEAEEGLASLEIILAAIRAHVVSTYGLSLA